MEDYGLIRVIGSNSLYRYFLPQDGLLFSGASFHHIEPQQGARAIRFLPKQAALSIIVDPFDYGVRALGEIQGPTIFWCLSPLAVSSDPLLSEAPRMYERAKARAADRLRVVSELALAIDTFFVVSDEASQIALSTLGIESAVSPPPVSEDVIRRVWLADGDSNFATVSDNQEYAPAIWAAIEAVYGLDFFETTRVAEPGTLSRFFVIAGDLAVPSFPYEAAVSLVAGQTLLSPKLMPSWGLEAGIDYLQYSSPDELAYIMLHLERWTQSTRLMRHRALQKAEIFEASRVLSTVLRAASRSLQL